MLLTSLELAYVRNYQKRIFSFSPNLTYIIGPNTSGKTNILEAIYACATGRSFRALQDREMIQWENPWGRIKTQIDDTTLELLVTGGQLSGGRIPTKKFFVNGVARRMTDFVGHLRAVLFWPEHMELVTDSPSLRRKYLDSVLVQVDREYQRNLISFERGLRQRNRLLDLINEGKANRNQLAFWNQLLIKSGGYLTDARAQYIEFVNKYPTSIHHYHLEYDKSVISPARLAQYALEEIAAKATLVGPHRDDFVFLMDPKHHDRHEGEDEFTQSRNLLHAGKFGSRGEQRLAVLWLKLSEAAFILEKTAERPLLLLDDIFSELDSKHRGIVVKLIGNQQTIVTSADHEIINLIKKENKGKMDEAEIIRLTL